MPTNARNSIQLLIKPLMLCHIKPTPLVSGNVLMTLYSPMWGIQIPVKLAPLSLLFSSCGCHGHTRAAVADAHAGAQHRQLSVIVFTVKTAEVAAATTHCLKAVSFSFFFFYWRLPFKDTDTWDTVKTSKALWAHTGGGWSVLNHIS